MAATADATDRPDATDEPVAADQPADLDRSVQPQGLTAAEVQDRIAKGLVNINTDAKTKTVGEILAEHTFTLFNGVNLMLAIIVFFTGSYRNMLFMLLVVLNLFISVFQEIRAKRMVDKLAILTQKAVVVIRADGEVELAPSELVCDDLIRLSRGDQVPCDSTIVTGNVSVDESLLTGEAKPVSKGPGDELLSGSFIDSGGLVARVTRVGQEGYAAKINAEAKHVKKVSSEILDTINAIIRLATYALFPLGIALFARTVLMDGGSLSEAALTTVSAVLGMIPQGLILLISSVLAIATIRLGGNNVLVQQSYCVETLARVDVLCLDKTGTITTGHMEVSNVKAASGVSEGEVQEAFASIARGTSEEANETSRALIDYADKHSISSKDAARVVPFSSDTKLSGIVSTDGQALVMGAANFVLSADEAESALDLAAAEPTERVIVVAKAAGFDDKGAPVAPIELLGTVAIRDEIRETASDTISFFNQQGVELRVISGDDPKTVSSIATRVGIPGADAYVDSSTLTTPELIADAVDRYRVFGRVTPQQKRDFVKHLQSQGHVVAMTGDGVNDVLALRESDCSVAMASGSAAARNVSEIVLADSDFVHMPEVVAEGRRSINNLQRSSTFFLVKTVYSMLLALICIFIPPYPFIPIQMSLINMAVIGMPSFVLALEPNHDRVRGSFLANVLSKSLPASLAVAISLLAALVVGRNFLSFDFAELSTVCTVLNVLVGIALIVCVSRPLTPLRVAVLVFSVVIVALGCTVFVSVFEIAPMSLTMAMVIAVCGVASVALLVWLYGWSQSHYETDERFQTIVRKVEGVNDVKKRRDRS